MERDFKEWKLTKEEIRLIGLAIADTIIDNNAKLKAHYYTESKEEIERKNYNYKRILGILEYLER